MFDFVQVETIGDAYMVVGGIPKQCPDHAHRVCYQALDMMQEAKEVSNPNNNQSLEVCFYWTRTVEAVVCVPCPHGLCCTFWPDKVLLPLDRYKPMGNPETLDTSE